MRAYITWKDHVRVARRHPVVHAGLYAVAVSLILALAAGSLFWWPTRHVWTQATAEVEAKRTRVVAAMQASEVDRAYVSAKREVAALDKKVQVSNPQTVLVQQLAKLARKHGIIIASEAFSRGREAKDLVGLNLEFNVYGSYTGLRALVDDIDALPTWTYIDEANMYGDQNHGKVSARLHLVTYRRVVTKNRD